VGNARRCSRNEGPRVSWRLRHQAGTLVYIGLPQPAALELNPFFDKRTRIVGSHGGDHWPAVDVPKLAQWALDGKLDLASMVTTTTALDDVERAFEDLRLRM
jgi:Zn-dependent alcohol dehydrogenase